MLEGLQPDELWQALGVIIAAIGAVASICYFLVRRRDQNLANSAMITVQYLRLFGGSEVPLLMKFLGKTFSVEQVDQNSPDPHVRLTSGGEHYMVHESLIACLQDLADNGLQPLSPCSEPLWDKYEHNKKLGQELSFLTAGSDLAAFIKWIVHNDIDQDGTLLDSADLAGDLIGNYSENSTSDYGGEVGYLFLILHNNSEKNLTELTLKFDVFNNLKISTEWISKYQEGYNSLKSYFFETRDLKHKLTNVRNAPTAEKNIKIANLVSLRDNIILLSVYMSDRNGFEERQLDDFYKPVRLEFKCDGKRFNVAVREPFRDDAAKIRVPYGWFSQ